MKQTIKPHSAIHRLLFTTVKQAHAGVERWFVKRKVGITPLQFGVLRSIDRNGATLNELARRMLLKPPSILPTIDLLEKRGYIARRNDPSDRRKINLILTAKGKGTIERVVSTRKLDPLSLAFKKMSAPRRKRLISLLTELSNGIKVDRIK